MEMDNENNEYKKMLEIMCVLNCERTLEIDYGIEKILNNSGHKRGRVEQWKHNHKRKKLEKFLNKYYTKKGYESNDVNNNILSSYPSDLHESDEEYN